MSPSPGRLRHATTAVAEVAWRKDDSAKASSFPRDRPSAHWWKGGVCMRWCLSGVKCAEERSNTEMENLDRETRPEGHCEKKKDFSESNIAMTVLSRRQINEKRRRYKKGNWSNQVPMRWVVEFGGALRALLRRLLYPVQAKKHVWWRCAFALLIFVCLVVGTKFCWAQSSPYDEFHYPGFRSYVDVPAGQTQADDFYITGGTITDHLQNPGFFSTEFLENCDRNQDYEPVVDSLAADAKPPPDISDAVSEDLFDGVAKASASGARAKRTVYELKTADTLDDFDEITNAQYGDQQGSQFQYFQTRFNPINLRENAFLLPDYQNNPFASRVLNNSFTEANRTTEFVPDDFNPDVALPHERLQVCHFALRLTNPTAQNWASVYRSRKVFVSYGFRSVFHFRVLHRNDEFLVGGRPSAWGQKQGGDGFAFVIQNNKRDARGLERAGMGYSGLFFTLAVEFDMYRDWGMKEMTGNHIAVMTSIRDGQPATASHDSSRIAETSDIPDLQEGTHKVEIIYDTHDSKADEYYEPSWFGDVPPDFLRQQALGRVGFLRVYLNDEKKLVVPLDLSQAVASDNLATFKWDKDKDNNADDDGIYPGRAYVGFSSSTKEEQVQSVDILDWHFESYAPCTSDNAYCRLSKNFPRIAEEPCKYGADFADPTKKGPRGTTTKLNCAIRIRNVARTPARVSARFQSGQDWEAKRCLDVDPATGNERTDQSFRGDTIEWNHVHPYFLGCNKTIFYNAHVTGLWLTSADGTRSVLVEDKHILDNTQVAFRRQAIFEYCLREHETDPRRYYQPADCNCAYCVRLFDIQGYYSVFYQDKCGARYGLFCRCLEVSDVGNDLYFYSNLQPMKYIRAPVCRGCTYHSHCTYVLKAGQCRQSPLALRLGNPLAPDPLQKGFIDFRLDHGLVKDGVLRGDVCDCEPGYITFQRNAMCQAGTGQAKSSIFMREYRGASVAEPITPDECYSLCDRESGCNFFTHWDLYAIPKGLCELFTDCPRTSCGTFDDFCREGTVYKMEAIGTYTNENGTIATPQLVYPLRQLQTNRFACFDCLRQFPEENCIFHCGPPQQVTFQHFPAGQGCASCIFAGNYMHELNANELAEIKSCVYAAIGNGLDPWVACDPVVAAQAARSFSHQISSALDLFNGVATHFITECPGRVFDTYGGFCAPNIYSRQFFPSFVLHHQGSKNNTIWPMGQLDCVNAICDLVPRDRCYSKLAEWNFAATGDVLDQLGNLHLLDTGGVKVIQGQGLVFDKTLKSQYMVTPFMAKQDMQDVTLEVWATVPPEEGVKDALFQKTANLSASTSWKDRYAPAKAMDQDMDTYWSTDLFTSQRVDVEFFIDFQKTVWAEGWKIIFFHRALDFLTFTAEEGYYGEQLPYVQLNQVLDNNDYEVDFSTSAYFRGRYFKLLIERVLDRRATGPGAGMYCVTIREIEVYFDRNLARLHPTNQTYAIDYNPSLLADGDEQTYWSSPPFTGFESAVAMVEFSSLVHNIAYTRISWNLKPASWFLYVFKYSCGDFRGPVPPAGATYTAADVSLIMSKVSDFSNFDPDIVLFTFDARCVILDLVTSPYYDKSIVQIREFEVAAFDANQIRGNATLASTPGSTNLVGLELYGVTRGVDAIFDNDLNSYFYSNALGYFTIDFLEPVDIFRIRVVWPTLGGVTYSPAGYTVSKSLDDGASFPTLRDIPVVPSGADHVLIFPGSVTVLLLRFTLTTFNPNAGGYVGISEVEFFKGAGVPVQKAYAKPSMQAPTVYESSYFDNVYERTPFYDQDRQPFAWQDLNPVVPFDEKELFSAERLCDGNKATMFLSTVNMPYPGGTETLRVTLPFTTNERVDVVAVEWVFRPDSLILQCGADVLKNIIPGTMLAYLYPWDAIDYVTFCPDLTLTMAMPRDFYGDYKLVGIREVRAYEFGVPRPIAAVSQFLPSIADVTASGDANLILNSNDPGYFASAGSPGVWSTSAIVIPGEEASIAVQRKRVSVVLDLGPNDDTFWGAMIDFGPVFPSNMDVFASYDGVAFSIDPIFTIRGKIDAALTYLFAEFKARYIKVSFLDPGTAEITTVVGNTTTTGFQVLTTYQLRRVHVFKSPNKILGVPAVSNDRFEHTSEIAVDGNLNKQWINYIGSSFSTLMVNLLEKREVVGDMFIKWFLPAKDFSVEYTDFIDPITGLGRWTHLETVTGNLLYETVLTKNFDAQYIRINMTRSAYFDLAQSPINRGQVIFGIRSVELMFEGNVAMGKQLQIQPPRDATPQVDARLFAIDKAFDESVTTFWFANVAEPTTTIEMTLTKYQWVAGLEMIWRYCPDIFHFEGYNSNTGLWFRVPSASFDFTDPLSPIPRQTLSTFEVATHQGFEAEKIRLVIEKKRFEPQGSYWAALKEFQLYKPAELIANTLTNRESFQRPPTADVPTGGGTDPNSLVDGSTIGAVWMAEMGQRAAIIRLNWDTHVAVGRVFVYWANIADEFAIDILDPANVLNSDWEEVYYTKGNTGVQTQLVLFRRLKSLRVRVIRTFFDISLFEIRVWEAVKGNNEIRKAEDLGQPFDGDVKRATDPDTNTFWMPRPQDNQLEAILDLNRIYTVTELKMWWTWYPTRQIWYSADNDRWFMFLFRPDVSIFGLQQAEVGVDFVTKTVQMRYLKIIQVANYGDIVDGQLGAGLRDIRIVMDGNLARGIPATASSVWDYPLTNVVDGDMTTYWAGELRQSDAHIFLDLQYTRNVAGLRMQFGDNYPTLIQVYFHDAASGRYKYATETSTQNSNVFEMPATLHFQTRYVSLRIRNPKIFTGDPDFPNDSGRLMQLLQIYDIQVYEHRGGGGLFGLENTKTGDYSTIAFAQYQPLQWNVASNSESRSDANFVTSEKEGVGQMVHIVTTFDREGNIALFRNGEAYGNLYTRAPAVTWAQGFDDTRLVFGVRTTSFAQNRGHISGEFEESNLGTSADMDPRSAFFHGTIHRASIIKGALLTEEVRGLYMGVELGCHCFDACPVGSTRFFPHVPVPCSGHGACRRSPDGKPFAPGSCDCLPGYSGNACQFHCSEISETGCCDGDDDCPCDKSNAADCARCDLQTKACEFPGAR
ncbi:unnamed protein product [Amoebophrya sp. A25]|nr:unnamed protein product [Amoebophrya sp. A25]|eukprot:GSA25T00025319001.1